MGDQIDPLDAEVAERVEEYKQETARMIIDAYNEGYLLGRKHAESVYGKVNNDEN